MMSFLFNKNDEHKVMYELEVIMGQDRPHLKKIVHQLGRAVFCSQSPLFWAQMSGLFWQKSSRAKKQFKKSFLPCPKPDPNKKKLGQVGPNRRPKINLPKPARKSGRAGLELIRSNMSIFMSIQPPTFLSCEYDNDLLSIQQVDSLITPDMI